MTSLVLHAVRKRPLISLGLAGASGIVTTACTVEYMAELREQEWIKNHPHKSHSSPVSPSNKALSDASQPNLLPRVYDREAIRAYWMERPVTVACRFGQVFYELAPLAVSYVWDFKIVGPPTKIPTNEESPSLDVVVDVHALAELQRVHSAKLREALTNLGPAWVKAGQQLSIRPDLVPPPVLKELQKLCDSVRPIPDEVALALIRKDLGHDNLSDLFGGGDDNSEHGLQLVAAASLGQVYKARLRTTGDHVAIKVQRPGMRKNFSLDLFFLQQYGGMMDSFTSAFTKQKPFYRGLFDSYSKGSYSELDYELEADNQKFFQRELAKRKLPVVVPNVYSEYTTESVLTTQWIDGIKLADSGKDRIRELVPVGVELFLIQLLDIGVFHCDPHAGNLLITNDTGKLCLLDFGLCAHVDPKARLAMTKAIVHLLARDFTALVEEDAKELGFFPDDFEDIASLTPLLTKVLTGGLLEPGSDLQKRKRKLMEISSELNEIFFRYPFQVPPFFALVTRGLGLLEGIALTGDPEFDIFQASAPYARKRAMAILGNHTLNRLGYRGTSGRA